MSCDPDARTPTIAAVSIALLAAYESGLRLISAAYRNRHEPDPSPLYRAVAWALCAAFCIAVYLLLALAIRTAV